MNVKDFTSVLTAVTGFIVAVTALYHEYRMDRDSKIARAKKALATVSSSKEEKSKDKNKDLDDDECEI